MILIQVLLYFICIHSSQIISPNNLYYTNQARSNNNKNDTVQYNCLSILIENKIFFYCMNEYSSEFPIENSEYNSNLTFIELAKRNITSEQLYFWSAPIDLIEKYQFYLDTKNSSSDNEIYLNCSWPRFGLQCEYELDIQSEEIIEPTTLTCYTHLQCNSNSVLPIYLHWADICDGKVDCPNNAIDEQDCLQLEINSCQNDEYRCWNGPCIPRSFQKEYTYDFECFDRFAETGKIIGKYSALNHVTTTIRRKSYYQEVCRLSNSWTRYCEQARDKVLVKAMFTTRDESIHENCWSAFKDLLYTPDMPTRPYGIPCSKMNCLEEIEAYCPPMLFIPNVPVLFNDIYLAYQRIDAADYYNKGEYYIHYLCPNNPRYYELFTNHSKISFKNRTCFRPLYPLQRSPSMMWALSFDQHLRRFIEEFSIYDPTINYPSNICHRSDMYQCQKSSKCISIHRVRDSHIDCPHKDDEDTDQLTNDIQLIEKLQKTHFLCSKSNNYISYTLVDNVRCDCQNCSDETNTEFDPYQTISFQTVCDGFTHLKDQLIDGKNETDETECQYWSCNNIYTRCNGLWQCPNGEDEIGCLTSSVLNCSSDYHLCISLKTYRLHCLPKEKIFDGSVDCVGATDEPHLCRYISNSPHIYSHYFYCSKNDNPTCLGRGALCDSFENCDDGSDERLCITNINYNSLCFEEHQQILSDQEKLICQYLGIKQVFNRIHFQLSLAIDLTSNRQHVYPSNLPAIVHLSKSITNDCNYGIRMKVWLNNSKTETTCLCAANYYGDRCQYQNQRLALSIQFRSLSSSIRTIFTIIISLIDDSQQRIVHSYEQITYVSIRDCRQAFHMYLIYGTRPKDFSKNYYLHIDFYDRILMEYHSSILLPIKYKFLPVHRLVFVIEIPKTVQQNHRICSNKICGHHGKCIRYANQPDGTNFCLCNYGWSGQACQIQHPSACSSNSISIGITAQNRSICVCPMHRFGPRCLIINTVCQSNNNNNSSVCNQRGVCLPNDDSMSYNKTFTCICSNGYHGDRCEFSDENVTLVFHKDMILSPNIFIHFIQVQQHEDPLRSTSFRTVLTPQNSISIRWPLPFHMIFVEFEKKYYLAYIYRILNFQTISSSNRCPNLTELFNQTILQLHPTRKIKYYHLPCQNSSLKLSCFHDTIHLCLCQQHTNVRIANCFLFDHQMKYDCAGQNECENNAYCLHDKPQCPTRSMCICLACFYGSRCQFSTRGFGLSLDAILGYHIQPDISLTQQLSIVQFSLVITILFFIIGFIDSIICMLTFKRKSILELGCGLYLLTLSIITVVTMIFFIWKFFILLFTQTGTLSNRKFLFSQCYSIDTILRICLIMNKWLHACICMERTMTTIQGTRFNKIKSRRNAKYVISILLLITIGTAIHDPLLRDLLDEQHEYNDEIKRIWCTVRYSRSLQIYDYIIQSVHFIGAFVVNIISALVLIWKKTRHEQTLHANSDFKEIFKKQIKKYRYILISPLTLTILAIPRLAIVFISKCMQSTNDSWLFLIGYFISFLPSMLNSIVYILPSKYYKTELGNTMHQYQSQMRRRFNWK